MKTVTFVISVLIFISCSQNLKSETLITENLKYSAYYWSVNRTSNKYEIYLDHYINIDKNGAFVLMRHKSWKKDPQYFKGNVDSDVISCINNTFSQDSFKTNYPYSMRYIYDGLDYCFDYKIKNENRKRIQFISPESPKQIRILSALLESFIKYTDKTETDTLLLSDYSDTLDFISPSKLPPPIPPKLKRPK